jgi:hypothetical protein
MSSTSPARRPLFTTQWLADEHGMLATRLSDHFGVDTGAASVARAIEEWNRFCRAVLLLGDLRKKDHPPINRRRLSPGRSMAGLASPKDLLLPAIESLYAEIQNREGTFPLPRAPDAGGGAPPRPRLHRQSTNRRVGSWWPTGSAPGPSPGSRRWRPEATP